MLFWCKQVVYTPWIWWLTSPFGVHSNCQAQMKQIRSPNYAFQNQHIWQQHLVFIGFPAHSVWQSKIDQGWCQPFNQPPIISQKRKLPVHISWLKAQWMIVIHSNPHKFDNYSSRYSRKNALIHDWPSYLMFKCLTHI